MPVKTFEAKFENLSRISSFVLETARNLDFSDFDIYAIETAVDEACSNIIEHAYKDRKDGLIQVEVTPNPGQITITLTDNGIRFDPDKIKPPNLKCPLKDRANNGLGLYFIYQWMDVVQFSFTENGNQLIMAKLRGK